MSPPAPLSYLVAGHVCIDELPGRPDRLGGTVFFSAGQASAMGCEVTIRTTCTPGTSTRARAALAPGIVLDAADAPADTRFEFGVDAEAGPRRLASRAPRVEHLGHAADVVHLAPVFDELAPGLLQEARTARFVGATPQGFLRGTDGDGRLTFVAANWPTTPDFADAIALNDDEYRHLDEVGLLGRFDGLVFRTLGPDGAAVLRHGRELARHAPVGAGAEVPARRTIGAGDVFAAAAFVTLAAGGSAADAVCAAVESATAWVRRPADEPSFSDGRPGSPARGGSATAG